jgi:flagellar protein FlaG
MEGIIMRIESMDASFSRRTSGSEGVSVDSSQRQKNEINDSGRMSAAGVTAVPGANPVQTKPSETENTINEQTVASSVEKANKAISVANKRFEYSVHEETNTIMVKVIDKETDEVIREIPPEKLLDMVAKMWEMAGIIVDERR